jgi:hypothetical protein
MFTVSAAPLFWLSVSDSGPVELKNSVTPTVLGLTQTQTAPLVSAPSETVL